MARTISQTLLDVQQGTQRKPYIKVSINSVDYSSRLLFVEHHEESYRDRATLIFDNHDRLFDSVDLKGYRFRLGYGYYTGVNVAEPDGDNAGNEYSYAADLWVKAQKMISSPGQLECHLFCTGQWEKLREIRVIADADTIVVGDPTLIDDDPYFSFVFDATKTVYELIEAIIEGAMGWTLNAAPSPDDGILTSFRPILSLEGLPYAASVLSDLIGMTKCYLRPKANLTWDIVYPQSSDTVNATYYSMSAAGSPFYEYTEEQNLVIPNRIVVFANNPKRLPVWPKPVVVGDTGAYSGGYGEVLDFELAHFITTQLDANNRASARLTRIQAEAQLAGYLIIPHDARIESYDRIRIEDTR